MKTQLITKRKLQSNIMQYAIITLVILAVGGYFGYRNYTEYQATQSAYDQESSQLGQLKAAADKSHNDYLALKKDLDTQNSGVDQSIDKILPPTESFTELARDLDQYFINTNTSANPLFLSDLRFSPPRVDDQSEFGVLPLAMTITGSEAGFKDFLTYIEGTGDLNSQTRLLDIANLNLSYANDNNEASSTTTTTDNTDTTATAPQAAPTQQVSASVSLNAYFQKPAAGDTPAAQ